MRYIGLLNLTFGLILFGYNSDIKSNASTKIDSDIISKASANRKSEALKFSNNYKDKDEIQTLIRQMLKWANSKSAIDLLPILSKDSICVGFDFDEQNLNLEKLRKTGFFADEFIDNYKSIIQTLDKKIKNKEFEKWNIYELPTFNFANDVNPWCSCQDNLSWDHIEVEPIKLSNDKGELKWNWGKLDSSVDSSWKDFSYTFRVVKVDNKWKISYLQGFDYKESIK
jgi:hypothetical protein